MTSCCAVDFLQDVLKLAAFAKALQGHGKREEKAAQGQGVFDQAPGKVPERGEELNLRWLQLP